MLQEEEAGISPRNSYPLFTGLNNWYTSYRDALQVITATTKLPKIIAKEIHLDKLINTSVL
jgi:hypothetical protein